MWRTDGRTDRRTDRILIARPRLHFMQRGKNTPRLILTIIKAAWRMSAGLYILLLSFLNHQNNTGPARAAAPGKIISEVVSMSWTLKKFTQTFRQFLDPPNFTGAKFGLNFWPLAVAFDKLWFRNGETYPKSQTSTWSATVKFRFHSDTSPRPPRVILQGPSAKLCLNLVLRRCFFRN